LLSAPAVSGTEIATIKPQATIAVVIVFLFMIIFLLFGFSGDKKLRPHTLVVSLSPIDFSVIADRYPLLAKHELFFLLRFQLYAKQSKQRIH
jgi:hypothetical protein